MKHWKISESNEILILTIDMADKSANVLSTDVIKELHKIIFDLYLREKKPKGLIIRSGKSGGFILGANVEEFKEVASAKEAEKAATYVHSILNAINELPFPTVAAIDGFCLGGGLELALACKYRVATDSDKTRLGLPEVLLGIHPGFGGTVRLPKLIGDLPALNMMLSGRTMRSKVARKIGLVDDVVPERYLIKASVAYIEKCPARKPLSLIKRIPGWTVIRPLVAWILRKKVSEKVNPDHYPAPFRIIDLWLKYSDKKINPEFLEAESLGKMLTSDTSRSLVYLFLMREKLKREAKSAEHNVKHIHVIGAGVMGADIAIWAASKGFTVSLSDKYPKVIADATKRAYKFFKKKIKDPIKVQEAMDRLIPDMKGRFLKKADLVIEAVVENAKIKQAVFREVESAVSANTILATNTSSIPLEVIAESLNDPTRLVGLHFFNPVAKMELVEIVKGEKTAGNIVARAKSFASAIDKLPLEVKSSPGFLVNRLLMPYLFDAVTLFRSGTPIETIDRSAVDFGMPMGPITLADTVGLDVCLFVAEELSDTMGISVPPMLREMVAEGKLGRKSGRGFYRYKRNGKLKGRKKGKTDPEIANRLITQIVNETERCLKDRVVADKDDLNIGVVFGTGFAPFKGGPLGR